MLHERTHGDNHRRRLVSLSSLRGRRAIHTFRSLGVHAPQGFLRHPDFLRLVHELGIPLPHALGCLIFLWTTAATHPQATFRDELDIELCGEWPGERGRFCAALLLCAFIRRREDGGFAVLPRWEGGAA